MDPTTVYTIDWSRVSAEILKGLQDGTMKVSTSNGNVYWAAGSGNTGMVANLPFVPSQVATSEQLLQMAGALQATVVGAAVVSTAVIVGAIVVQTVYLSRKLDKLQDTLDAVGQAVHLQGVVTLMQKATDYFGAVEAARQLMQDPAMAGEAGFVAAPLLADLAVRRNGLSSFVERLLALAEEGAARAAPDTVSQAQYQLILDFSIETLANLPAGLYVERELYAFVGKYQLSEHIGRESAGRYRASLQDFKAWCNRQSKAATAGRRVTQAIWNADASLRALFDNELNDMLLGRHAPVDRRGASPMAAPETPAGEGAAAHR